MIVLAKSKVFVSGADGFIGSHLVETLVRAGFGVKALAFYNSHGSAGWLDVLAPEVRNEVEVVFGDVRDPELVHRLVGSSDFVFHLASLIGIPYSFNAPRSYIETNVTGTLNICEAALRSDVERLIHVSTSEVYGSACYVPMDEKHRLSAQSPYAASKIAADQLVNSFHASFNLPVVTIRPFNTFGPRQSLRALIPTIIQQALIGGRPEIRVGSLTPTRDFSFVTDTVGGMVEAINLSAESWDQAQGCTFNLGSGFEISVLETIRLICDIIECEAEIVSAGERVRPNQSEVTRLWSDNRRARQYLSWTPQYADMPGFRVALAETIDWYRTHSDLIWQKGPGKYVV